MNTELALTINFDSNVTVSDLLEQKTLDVTSLKQDDIDAPVRAHVNDVEALDERSDELVQIETFIQKNGVTRPTEEDYIPKSQAWSRNVKSKAEKLAENPNYIERRGRKRTTYFKNLSFVRVVQADKGLIDKENKDQFKRAGRGRAKKGEVREVFEIYFTHVDTVTSDVWTRAQLIGYAKRD
jgi:hypothetical protein